jgi:hypothetical protein
MAVETDPGFNPPLLLRQPDIQNLLSSLGLRHSFLRRRTKLLEHHTKKVIVDGGNGVRLTGELSTPPIPASSLVIMIHGWEGCSQSAYMISAALALFEAGFSVCRLNLRDHGDSHQLNEGLFNSTLLDEVLGAIDNIQQRWPHERTFIAGFSLGGNFILRIAHLAPSRHLAIQQAVAICPVMNPADTLRALQNALFVYERYFVRRWRNSLLKKLHYFPHYNYRDELLELNDLQNMHEFFVPRFTPYANPDQYFSAYAITETTLNEIQVPTYIINSEDDPITKAECLPASIDNPNVCIQRPPFGSHCAFLQDYRLTSWVDDQLVSLFTSDKKR